MISKKNFLATIIILIVITVIRNMDIDNIPKPILFAILLAIIVYLFIFVLRYKGDSKERMYLLVMTIQVALLVIILLILVVIQDRYPEISYNYKPVLIVVMAILFISLIVTVYSLAFYKHKNNKYNDK